MAALASWSRKNQLVQRLIVVLRSVCTDVLYYGGALDLLLFPINSSKLCCQSLLPIIDLKDSHEVLVHFMVLLC